MSFLNSSNGRKAAGSSAMKKWPTFGFSLLTSTPRPVAEPLKTPLRTSTIRAKPYPLCPECSSPSPPRGRIPPPNLLDKASRTACASSVPLPVLTVKDLKLPTWHHRCCHVQHECSLLPSGRSQANRVCTENRIPAVSGNNERCGIGHAHSNQI